MRKLCPFRMNPGNENVTSFCVSDRCSFWIPAYGFDSYDDDREKMFKKQEHCGFTNELDWRVNHGQIDPGVRVYEGGKP